MIDPSVLDVIDEVKSEKSSLAWSLFGYDQEILYPSFTGSKGPWRDVVSKLKNEEILYGLAKVCVGILVEDESKNTKKFQSEQSARFLFLIWVGSEVRGLKKAKALADRAAIKTLIGSFSVELYAEDVSDLNEKLVMKSLLKSTAMVSAHSSNLLEMASRTFWCVARNEMDQTASDIFRTLSVPVTNEPDFDDLFPSSLPTSSSAQSLTSLEENSFSLPTSSLTDQSHTQSSSHSSMTINSSTRFPSNSPTVSPRWRRPETRKSAGSRAGFHLEEEEDEDNILNEDNVPRKPKMSFSRDKIKDSESRHSRNDVSPSISSDDSSTLTQRQQVINEILETEKSYCKSLETCIRGFLIPLKNSSVISTEKIQNMFCNLEEIYYLHKGFLEKLDHSINSETEPAISELFLEFTPKIVVYGEYIQNCNIGLRTYKKCLSKSTKFSTFIQNCRQDAELQRTRMDIPSFLIMPVQRIPRYELLLKDLLKKTPSDNTQIPLLKESIEALEKMGKFINEHGQLTKEKKRERKRDSSREYATISGSPLFKTVSPTFITRSPSGTTISSTGSQIKYGLTNFGNELTLSDSKRNSPRESTEMGDVLQKLKQYEEKIIRYEKSISEKDRELKELRNKMIELEFKNQELSQSNQQLTKAFDTQKKELENFQKNFNKLSKKF